MASPGVLVRPAGRGLALLYLTFLLVIPVVLVFWRTFENGVQPVIDGLTSPATLHAFQLTAVVAFYAVLANTVFGVVTALLLVRYRFHGKRVLNALIDLPLAVSPVIVGLALILVYGRTTGVGRTLAGIGINVIFSVPGMVMATIFVCIPLVVRAVAPVLEEIGDEQEQAARTLGAGPVQTFRRITLPASELIIQPPNGRTLVNFDTNFYTEPLTFDRTVRLLGHRVDLHITVHSYRWDFGDGEGLTSTEPGAPYPKLEITHNYLRKAVYWASLDTTYTADFRVDGGPWRLVPGTVTIDGEAERLQAIEARPTLVG